MKRSEELLGLSVISIEDGRELGRVSDLIINPTKGIAEYFIIDNGLKYLGFKILPFQLVEGVGEDAVTVQSSSAVSDMSEEPEITGLLEKDVRIKGTKILTKKGKLVGSVADFIVDEDAGGKISSCIMEPVNQKGKRISITADNIITFGKDVLVIGSEPEVNDPDNGPGSERKQPDAAVNEAVTGSEDIKQRNDVKQQGLTAEEIKTQEIKTEEIKTEEIKTEEIKQETVEQLKAEQPRQEQTTEQPKQEKSEAARLFEQRQRQYLLGRKVSKRIENEKGEVIAEEGQVITNDLIDKAKTAGKFSELSMNTRS